MLYLILTILLNVYLTVAFKIFQRLKIDTLQAIVVNYWVCVITGSIFLGHFPVQKTSFEQPWIFWSLVMGASFFTIFNLIGFCTKVDGITTTTIANKLSLVIPVGFALWLYGDLMTVTKAAGILIAFPAVYLSTRTKDEQPKKMSLLLPFLLFIGSGLLDTLVNYVAHQYFTTGNDAADSANQSVYLIHTFFAAGTIGTIIAGASVMMGKRTFAWKNVLGGIVLGIPNYFSIYFLFRLLQSGFLPGSAAIPVNNIGIVLVAALVAVLFFGEKANRVRILGMALSLIAIILIMLSGLHGNIA
jgi:drug/metabolite transporter (DMT)-like permease